ncbi:hypothetical protein ACIOHC_35695 [Streptomyces sp. NPDC088252]|uniref:hypothetical protein n=1 Tax=Streptomyces sp. NPDC088252 TaxID=3365845 RepID=UPI00382C8B6A
MTIVHWCDMCEKLELPKIAAVAVRHLAIDGGPRKRYDFCAPHDVQLRPWIALYEEAGVEMERRGKQLEAVSALAIEQGPTQVEEEEKVWVTCPLDHQSGKTNPRPVAYKSRSSHAKAAHEIAVWEIKWGDPDGVLTFPCTSHKECKETGLAFTNVAGWHQHNRLCPLDRIDV